MSDELHLTEKRFRLTSKCTRIQNPRKILLKDLVQVLIKPIMKIVQQTRAINQSINQSNEWVTFQGLSMTIDIKTPRNICWIPIDSNQLSPALPLPPRICSLHLVACNAVRASLPRSHPDWAHSPPPSSLHQLCRCCWTSPPRPTLRWRATSGRCSTSSGLVSVRPLSVFN